MKKTKKILYLGLVIAIASFLCLQAGAITLTNRSTELDQKLTPSSKNLFAGNTLISEDNPNKHDTNPKITRNGLGDLVVVYQREVNPLLKTIPLCSLNLNSATVGSITSEIGTICGASIVSTRVKFIICLSGVTNIIPFPPAKDLEPSANPTVCDLPPAKGFNVLSV